MMHRCRRQSAKTEHPPLIVGIDEIVDGVSSQQCLAFLGRYPERLAQLRGIDRAALGKLAIKRNRDPLLFGQEAGQVAL